MGDFVRQSIACRVRNEVRLELGPNTLADAVAGRRILLSGTDADAIADSALAAIESTGHVVVRRHDVFVAWSWACEAFDELAEAKELGPALREQIQASLDRLYALLETPQPGPEDAVLSRRELLARMTADSQDTYGKPTEWFENGDPHA